MLISKKYSYILVICSLIGLVASFLLTIDIIKLTANPDLDLPCNLSPFISCKSVIESSQGKVFGFPNPLLGIAGFSFILATGVLMLFGAEPSRKFWKFFTAGITLVIILIHWFIFQSIYIIGSLCLYCMVTWSITWPIFLFTIIQYFNLGWLNKNRVAILIGWYLLIILLILLRFREYFLQ